MTACLTAVGVVSALYHRNRTGEGQMIDTALLQTGITFMAPIIGEWETGGKKRTQTGNRAPWYGPSDLYRTKDGRWVMLPILTNSIWRRFCQSIDREDLLADSRFHDDLARWEYHDIIDPVVSEWVASHTADEIIELAEKIPIPAGICYEQTEVAHDPQVKAREMLVEVPTPDSEEKVLVTGLPIRLSATPTSIERSFPAVGQHNEEIYGKLLGYNQEDLKNLEAEGII